jgi:hypothetical protein
MRHRCVEDDSGDGGRDVDGDGGGSSEDPITRAVTFSFSSSLSSPDEQLEDSILVSQSPTM